MQKSWSNGLDIISNKLVYFNLASVANSVRVNNNLAYLLTHTLLTTLAELATEAVITLSNLAQ